MRSGVTLIKSKMEELGLSPKKFLGQHFLINSLVIKKTVEAVEALNPSLIIEVGPGLGALTDEFILLKCPLFLVEQDSVLCEYWRKKEVPILEGDVLKVNWSLQLQARSVLTGNLPYQIASRLVIQCCPGPVELKAMVLMFQKEVAERIRAKPCSKSYGLLSVLAQCFWSISFLTEASLSDFYPRPKVAGQVLVFHKKPYSIKDSIAFLLFVKLCFSQRRKILLNRLKKQEKIKDDIVGIFDKMNLSPLVRAEELSPEQFVFLFKQINETKVSI